MNDLQRVSEWLVTNTPCKSTDKIEWLIALWYTENMHELTHKDQADMLLSGHLMMATAVASMVEAIWENNDGEMVADVIASYF